MRTAQVDRSNQSMPRDGSAMILLRYFSDIHGKLRGVVQQIYVGVSRIRKKICMINDNDNDK